MSKAKRGRRIMDSTFGCGPKRSGSNPLGHPKPNGIVMWNIRSKHCLARWQSGDGVTAVCALKEYEPYPCEYETCPLVSRQDA